MSNSGPLATASDRSKGWIAGVLAYTLWGVFPLYFVLLARSGPVEIVAHRIVWSLVLAGALLAAARGWRRLVAVLRDRRTALRLAAAGVLVTLNWSTYVFGVLTGRTLEAALGYFVNPLTVVALGLVVLGEQLRALQWVAVGVGVLAVVVMVVAYGEVPWVALLLTVTFGLYSLVKKQVGPTVRPVEGLVVETATVTPVALVVLGVLAARGEQTFGLDAHGALLALAGVVTAVPLLLFATTARHLPMVGIGMLQYLSPLWQFLIGWLLLDEPMPAARWAGFLLVWLAVVIFVTDGVLAARRARRRRRMGSVG